MEGCSLLPTPGDLDWRMHFYVSLPGRGIPAGGPRVLDKGQRAEIWTLGMHESHSIGTSESTKAKPVLILLLP